jgi:tetratricopeptide (TPR) repeat protein
LQEVFRAAAPDFWSVRSTVVRLKPEALPESPQLEYLTTQAPSELTQGEAASDPDFTLEQAHRLPLGKGLEFERAELLTQAGLGFRNQGRLELAEGCLREVLTAVSNVSQSTQSPNASSSLASVLNNLSVVLSGLGQPEEALAKAQEAVRIYHLLAQARPDAFLPNLAGSLNNLANWLSALGRREEALAKAQEAARIYQQLAQAGPDAFLPDLAMSLNNLANRLSATGRCQEALAKVQEAEQIYQQLAQARPEACLPDLARSYLTEASILRALQRPAEAVSSLAMGLKAVTPALQKTPAAFRQLAQAMARDYVNAALEARIGPQEALLAPVEEALVEIMAKEAARTAAKAESVRGSQAQK